MDLSEAIKIKDLQNLARHPWETARLKIISFLISHQTEAPFRHIADVGAGDGFVLKHLLENTTALEFSAVDPAFSHSEFQEMRSWAGSRKLKLYRQLADLDPGTSAVDCLLLLDVIEHIADDKKFITDITQHALVSKSASWIITVPAFQSLFSAHDLQLKHYRRYRLAELQALCKACGLNVHQSGYFFFSLLPLRAMQKLFSRFSKKENVSTIENWKGGKAITKLIEGILLIDFKICYLLSKAGIHIPGLSCYCICH